MAFFPSLKSRWGNLGLHSKLIIAFLTVVVASTLVMTVVVGLFMNFFTERYLDQLGSQRAEQWRFTFTSYYIENGQSWDKVQAQLFRNSPGQNRGMARGAGKGATERVILLDEHGTVVADSTGGLSLGGDPPALDNPTIAPVILNNQQVGTIILGVDNPAGIESLEQRFSNSVLMAIFAAGAAALLLAVILAAVFSRRLSVPLVSLTEAANKLARKDFHHRLSISGADEIGTLAGAFNTMAEALEQNTAAKNRMIADVAHELRTPTAILRANLEALQAGVIGPTPETVSSLNEEILRLSRLIDDLQEVSLAESGQLSLNLRLVNLNELVQKVVHHFRGQAARKEIALTADLPTGKTMVLVDEDRIIQVLSNLLSNAVRHTSAQGRIVVRITEKPDDWVEVVVTDSGSGIDQADLPFVFDRFYRASRSRSRNDGGSGLGLAIAKGIVEAHGGRIKAESPPGGGAVFTIILPAGLG